jgi:3-oxoacyl-[acyl-carrier-protein] synthase-1
MTHVNAPVKITASGIVSALGQGKRANLDALLGDATPGPDRLSLSHFEEPVNVPYHGVVGAPEAAEGRLHWLLDQAMEELLAEHSLTPDQRADIPVFIGSSCWGIGIAEERYREQYRNNPETAIPLPLDGFGQISRHLQRQYGFHGADFALNTACTATANAILNAAAAINMGMHDHALVVGLEARNDTTLAGFHGMQLLAEEGMRPFDRRRDGLVLGEGCGAMLLSRSRPDASGTMFWGGASNCDTYSISASNPDGSTIAAVMDAAMARSGITPSDIRAIKAHGTATPLNDDGEAAGMRRSFATMPPFFSMKAALGHTLGSCGVLETLLMAAALTEGRLPASWGFSESDPALGVTPMCESMPSEPGYYLLNFFGFGGNNSSLILRHQD